MVDPVTARIWYYRVLFLCLSALLVFTYLLPLQVPAPRWAAPDLLTCLVMAWVVRRPEYVPALSVAAAFLAADLFFQRPPGLFTALVLVGTEFLRGRSPFMREFPFLLEWLVAGTVILAIMVAYRLSLMVALVDLPALPLTLMQFAATILAYPLVVAVSRYAFGVRRASAREPDRRTRQA